MVQAFGLSASSFPLSFALSLDNAKPQFIGIALVVNELPVTHGLIAARAYPTLLPEALASW
jgi:hypothetical protein